MFLAFFLAFAIKVPMFPFHTWLPDAHTEAPTVGSVVLAAVLLKMGTYGFIRFAIPLFPNAAMDAAWWICLLAVIGIIYGAWVAMVQDGRKEARGIFQRQPSRFRDAGHVCLDRPGARGKHPPDDQPRAEHGRSVPHRRDDLREKTYPTDRGIRWACPR